MSYLSAECREEVLAGDLNADYCKGGAHSEVKNCAIFSLNWLVFSHFLRVQTGFARRLLFYFTANIRLQEII